MGLPDLEAEARAEVPAWCERVETLIREQFPERYQPFRQRLSTLQSPLPPNCNVGALMNLVNFRLPWLEAVASGK
jgi:hypothetical protein